MDIKNYERELKYLISENLSFDMILDFLSHNNYPLLETRNKKKHEVYFDDNNYSTIRHGDVIRSSTHYNPDGIYCHYMYKKNSSRPNQPYVSKYEFGSGTFSSVNDFLNSLNVYPELPIKPVLHAEMTRETCVVSSGEYKLLISFDNVKYYTEDNHNHVVWEKMLEIEDWTTPHTLIAENSSYDKHLREIHDLILSKDGLEVVLTKDSKPYRGLVLLNML